uniref:Uncharacterized protein n=1 Tax=Panagrolaimus sp. JU765 TaxID=591449 RepID=A0AC34RDI8_9BILA
MFREKREKEDKARILEQQVQEIRLANEDLMNSLDPGIREEYEQIKEKAEEIRNETEEKQRELSELTKKKEEVDVALANSPLKQQAMGLQEQIAELEMKKAELVSQLNAEGTPEELRERIIEQIKKDNHEIANMQATTEEIEEKLAQAREELLEFQNEYDITAGEKNEKYRELKLKEAQIDDQDIQAELQSFDDVNALEMKTREKRNDLMAQKQQLESKLPHLEREVMTMKDNVDFINDAVRRDPKLQKVWSQTKLEKTIRNERDELRQKVKEKAAEVDYHELKEHAMALRKEYNAILVKAYGGR